MDKPLKKIKSRNYIIQIEKTGNKFKNYIVHTTLQLHDNARLFLFSSDKDRNLLKLIG